MLASHEDGGSLDDLKFSLASDIVELVVLTGDDAFLQTLRDTVGGARRLWHVLSSDKVPDLLVAGEVGILVFDVTALDAGADVFVREIKRQFPDLVVVVAGNRDAEVALAQLISAGTVYRFIHKPMSPNRARLFVDAAVKRHDEQRRRAVAAPAPRPPRRRMPWLRIALVGAALGILAAGLLFHGNLQRRITVQRAQVRMAAPASPLLERAAQALADNRLTEPASDNALALYQQLLAQNPADAQALAGIAEVRERLLATAENALLEERLDEAAAAIDAAARAGVQPGRISFLTAQLAKSRQQLKTVQSARAAKSAAAAQPPDASNTPATDPAAPLLELASVRMSEGHLLDPEQDNAWYYLSEALKADPGSGAAAEAKSQLGMRILSEARSAIDRREFARATEWIERANGIAAPANIETSQALLAAARKQAQSDAKAQLLRNGADRLQQDQLIEPDNDNAKYYLSTLRGLDAAYPGLAHALDELGARFVAKGRLALTLKQYAAARSWLDDAQSVGFASAEGNSVAHELDVALAREKFLADIVPASQLKLQKSVSPAYPARATSGRIEGWVELDYTVTDAGTVKDIAVHGASPPGIFEDAAMKAVVQWRYAPPAAAVRTRVRIRFTLPN